MFFLILRTNSCKSTVHTHDYSIELLQEKTSYLGKLIRIFTQRNVMMMRTMSRMPFDQTDHTSTPLRKWGILCVCVWKLKADIAYLLAGFLIRPFQQKK